MCFARLVDIVVEEYESIAKSRIEKQEPIITQQDLENIRKFVYQFADTQLVIRANVDGKTVSSLLLPPEEIEKFTDAFLDILEHEPEILLAES